MDVIEVFGIVYQDDIHRLTTLLDQGLDPNILNDEDINETMLHEASFQGYTNIVQLLLSRGANPNIQDLDETTPLHIACENGYIDIIKLLLQAGANPNTLNRFKMSPLHESAYDGSFEIINLLLLAGADPNLRDAEGNTVLGIIDPSNTEVINLLLSHGATK